MTRELHCWETTDRPPGAAVGECLQATGPVSMASLSWLPRVRLPPWRVVAKLGRLKMATFSHVTYAAAVCLAVQVLRERGLGSPDQLFKTGPFLSGGAFVLCCQMLAHFLGEYYDLPSDLLNAHGGGLTGGSKMLVTGQATPGQCLALAWGCLAASVALLFLLLPARCTPLGIAMIAIAHQYSAPPLKLNHRALGEFFAPLVMNVLLPQFAAVAQSDFFEIPAGVVLPLHPSLSILVVPSALVKFALFVALNMADRRADWLGGKLTVPVLYGDDASARLLAAGMALAYASALVLGLLGACHWSTVAGVALSAPWAVSISRKFNPGAGDGPRPYVLAGLVLQCLKHAPCVVLAVFLDCILREVTALASGHSTPGAAVVAVLLCPSIYLRCLLLGPFVHNFLSRRKKHAPTPPPAPAPSSAAGTPGPGGHPGHGSCNACQAGHGDGDEEQGVVVVGAGVGGLILGACLQRLGLPFKVLEREEGVREDDGADLALWPSAISVLKELGVGASGTSSESFWDTETYPVGTVYLSKTTDATNGGGSEVLQRVSMDAVVEDTGESFRLVGRKALMASLRPLVEEGRIAPGARAAQVRQCPLGLSAAVELTPPTGQQGLDRSAIATPNSTGTSATSSTSGAAALVYSARVVCGADGIRSVCRRAVTGSGATGQEAAPGADGAAVGGASAVATGAAVRYGGEMCYRGTLDLRGGSPAADLAPLFREDEKARPRSMTVTYGDKVRFSWGFLDASHSTGYWFIKQLTPTAPPAEEDQEARAQRQQKWPEPIRTLAGAQGKGCNYYAHSIQDCQPLGRWSSANVTLLGDACHAVTPNNGQGACMAIEDALVLATLLRRYWQQPDGHVEAFYQYERARRDHTAGIHRDSHRQMKLGQLTSPMAIRAREFLLRSIPSSVLQRKLRDTNVFDIEPYLAEFRGFRALLQQS